MCLHFSDDRQDSLGAMYRNIGSGTAPLLILTGCKLPTYAVNDRVTKA